MRALSLLTALVLIGLFVPACGSETSSGGETGPHGGAEGGGDAGSGGDEGNEGGTGGDGSCTTPGPIRGSCRLTKLPTCFDFTGTLEVERQRAACEDQGEGSYSTAPCDRNGAKDDGGCLMDCGLNTEIVTYMYEGAFVDHKPFCLAEGDTWIDN